MRRLLVLALFALACRSAQQPADLLLTNGRVFTADPSRPWADTIAIRGNRIVALEVMPALQTIDLQGRLVVPGINDAHVHEPWLVSGRSLDLQRAKSVDEIYAAVAAAPLPWVNATIPVTLIDNLTRSALDVAVPSKPVALRTAAGHSALLNSAALRAWNIDTADGWIYENQLWIHDRAATEAAPDDVIVAEMQRFANEAIRYGVTSVQSMPSVKPDRIAPLAAQTPLRWRFMEVEMGSVPDAPQWPTKYIADGTPVERDAALREPYSDRPNTRGAMNFTDDQIRQAVNVAARSNQQLLFHAAGELPLEKFFAAMNAIPIDWRSKRVRIEHGDFISEFLPDAKRLGVIVVQNPAHFMIRDLVLARYGADRLRNFQMMRSLLDNGVPLAIGSDGPINPWLNIMFATLHPNDPSEALTREQALIAYTRGSAFAEFAERDKGTIAVGMLADIAVLSQDIFKVPTPELPKTQAVMTIIGGRVVYK